MYGSVSGHRSAISAYHTQINNIAIVEHPKFCALTVYLIRDLLKQGFVSFGISKKY